jgi:hypothetical protein
MKRALSDSTTGPNMAVHVTAARLRMLLSLKGHGRAAARDGECCECRESGSVTSSNEPGCPRARI